MLMISGCGFVQFNVLLFFMETEEDCLVVSKELGIRA